MAELERLVTEHEGKRIPWKDFAAVLDRAPKDCEVQWVAMQNSRTKRGIFSPEEDAIIRQRVAEWGDKGPGLFTAIGKEINRSLASVRSRWNARLKYKANDAAAGEEQMGMEAAIMG